jgi:hypothetical protein
MFQTAAFQPHAICPINKIFFEKEDEVHRRLISILKVESNRTGGSLFFRREPGGFT